MAIAARNLLVQLANDELADPYLKLKVDSFTIAREIDSLIITNDAQMLLSSSKKLYLNSGLSTLKKEMGLRYAPTRLYNFHPLPNDFIVKCFPDGYDEKKIYFSFGKKFQQSYVNSILQLNVEKERNRVKNQHVLSTNTLNLVKDGSISLLEVSRVEQNKKILEKLYRENHCNPDLEGPMVLVFERWVTDQTSCCSVKDNKYPPTLVTLIGRPKQTHVKLKHYAIYSKLPGFGKTYQFKRLSELYNVHFVNDPTNWTAVPSGAQFLVFDEIGCDHNKLSFENLKALTGGTSDAFTGNCKTFGESFRPRDDVQVVMLSNQSPYEIYGKWNSTLQRRVMSKQEMEQFHDRFEVICLDGSVTDDLVRALTPEAWSETQFSDECRRITNNMFASLMTKRPPETNVSAVITAVDMIVCLCRQRESENIFATDMRVISILTELDDGRFWPSLVETFNACYEGMARKRKGRALTKARDRLVRRLLNEKTRFESLQIEQLAEWIATEQNVAYGLFRFYGSAPHYIDFATENKERAFRRCLSVHNNNPNEYEERIYRTLVFERVWNVAETN